jgi:hypothetical protein
VLRLVAGGRVGDKTLAIDEAREITYARENGFAVKDT